MRKRRHESGGLFNDLDTDLEAALNAATTTPKRGKAPEAEHVEPRPPEAPEPPGEHARRQGEIDRMFKTPTIADAIAITATECMSAGYGVMSIGILGHDTLIIQAFNGKAKLDATGTTRTVIDTLRELIKQARATCNHCK